MTCTAPIFVGDIGTIFRLTVQECIDDVLTPVDISSATTKEMVFVKPDGAVDTQTAVFTTDGTDGKIQYVSILNDLDAGGVWCLQGQVVMPAGDWGTSIVKFDVEARLG